MISIEVTCSSCWPPKKPALNFEGLLAKQIDKDALGRMIRAKGWVVEFNGEHMDTYCTKECAE